MRPTATIYVEVFGTQRHGFNLPPHGTAMMHVVSIALPDRDAPVRICPQCLDLLICRKVAFVSPAVREGAGASTS